MADLLDYLRWRGDLTLQQDPFGEVDALVLARISYLPFKRVFARCTQPPVSLKKAVARLKAAHRQSPCLSREDERLVELLGQSPRFYTMGIGCHVDILREKQQMQFSASTFWLGDGRLYIAFRGTDDTLIGWKENFNMTFICPVPSQKAAVRYLHWVAERTREPLLLGGHSKGGNLAMFAASFCSQSICRRIQIIHNFDGPGFDCTILEREGYKQMCGRMQTYLPQASVVGLMFQHGERYRVVQSSQTTEYLQHDIGSWMVDRNRFCYKNELSNGSRLVDRTLKGWLEEMDTRQRQLFVDTIYQVLAQSKLQRFLAPEQDWGLVIKNLVCTIGKLDGETRQAVSRCGVLLVKNLHKNIGLFGP